MAVDSVTTKSVSPNTGVNELHIEVTADSGDSIDLSDSSVTNGKTLSNITAYYVWDVSNDTNTTSNSSLSGTTLTLDSGQGNTDNDYTVIAWGDV